MSAPLTTLPRALEPWEPELRHFAADLAPVVGELTARLSQAIGPLRAPSSTPSDEPDGYASLSRRGPYERLLASEWALQLESPDEFVRRASAGEQLFLELERSSSAVTMEAWLLLDCGPGQLGAPRLVHLAALVAFSRRAREAGLLLRWASLRNWEQPPEIEFTPVTIGEWLGARSASLPTAFDAATWANQLPTRSTAIVPDVWVIGSATTASFASRHGWSSVTVGEQHPHNLELEVTVAPARARASAITLTLPRQRDQVRLLRDPFTALVPPPPPPPPSKRRDTHVTLHPETQLAFSHDGHRLLARTTEGSVTALPIRNTPRATTGWPKTALLPARSRFVAAYWASKRDRRVLVQFDASIWEATWEGQLLSRVTRSTLTLPLPSASEVVKVAHDRTFGFQVGETWFDAATEVRQPARSISASEDRVVLVADAGTPTALAASKTRFIAKVLQGAQTFTAVGQQALYAWVHRGAVTVISAPFEPGGGAQEWTIPSQHFGEFTPVALINTWATPALLGLRRDGETLGLLSTLEGQPTWRTEVRARGAIKVLATSNSGRVLAWRDEHGEIGVYSLDRTEVVSRVHVDDLTKERA